MYDLWVRIMRCQMGEMEKLCFFWTRLVQWVGEYSINSRSILPGDLGTDYQT
jgi:hypothetical protein